MESPDIWTLSLIEWQFFGTLTFKQLRLPERVRIGMFFAALREFADTYQVHFPKLLWCLRFEKGEATGRPHFHYLLAGLPRQGMNKGANFCQMEHWELQGGGMARVHLFDQRLNGVGYITKCLGESSELGGDVYESSKFGGGHCTLMLSHSAEKVIRREAIRQRGR
jgi:hypothetical protein